MQLIVNSITVYDQIKNFSLKFKSLIITTETLKALLERNLHMTIKGNTS